MKEKDLWKQFCNGCTSQWRAAGNKRFAYDKEKELSDVITDILGNSWLGGQILKYTGEIWNMKRMYGVVPEVNFFKITVYTFIWWIKEFNQKYTNPALKERYWPEFVMKVAEFNLRNMSSDPVEKKQFFTMIKMLKEYEDTQCNPSENFFLEIATLSYRWWMQEAGYFTDRDEGEEFKK